MRDPNELRQLIQQGLVDGVVVMEVRMQDERVNLLRQAGFPFSMIGRCADNTGISYADMDFEQVVQEMIGYLKSLGHTHIGYLNQSEAIFDAGYGPVVRTQAGFDAMIHSDGLHGAARFCRPNPRAGYEAFNNLLEQCPEMTALITMNERSIPGVMQAIADRGWRIPDDFSLTVIVSSAPVAEMVIPPLTTLDSPSAELGRLGVELLIQQLETQEQEAPQVLLPCKLVVRGSTAVCRPRLTRQTNTA
jgi:DNA-binding LacI/PurR family transcriptional regulator